MTLHHKELLLLSCFWALKPDLPAVMRYLQPNYHSCEGQGALHSLHPSRTWHLFLERDLCERSSLSAVDLFAGFWQMEPLSELSLQQHRCAINRGFCTVLGTIWEEKGSLKCSCGRLWYLSGTIDAPWPWSCHGMSPCESKQYVELEGKNMLACFL